MDTLFFFAACLGLAETIGLFKGRDFLLFAGKETDDRDYDTGKVFRAERWLFAADTIGCFILSKGSRIGFWEQTAVIVILGATLFGHVWVLNSEKFMTPSGIQKKREKKKDRASRGKQKKMK